MSVAKGATAAVVGVGATPYYKRGASLPATRYALAGVAILAALADAGLTIHDLDGFSYFAGGMDTAYLAQTLGIPRIRFTAGISGSGGGCTGTIGLAAMAVGQGMANVVACIFSVQQTVRYGSAFSNDTGAMFAGEQRDSDRDFIANSGLASPGEMFALIARRHMHEFGTTREHFGHVAVSTRSHAITRPTSLMRTPLSMAQYLAAPLIADPFCIYDFCLESDGSVCILVATEERARSLRQQPVLVASSVHGGSGRWGKGMEWFGMPADIFATSGMTDIAPDLYGQAGLSPDDIDVALLYDHFSAMVICQLEDFGFCERGAGGPFVAAGETTWPNGSLPVNTHGGNLSEGYMKGMSHIREAVEQLRGIAVNQVQDAKAALITSGPSGVPNSALILTR
jgi:acetyl-CoA acetyltransferase